MIFFYSWYSHSRNSLKVGLYLVLINIFCLNWLNIHGSLSIFNSHWLGCAMMRLYLLQFPWVKKCLEFFFFEIWYRRRGYKLLHCILTSPQFSGVSDLGWWTDGLKKVAIIVFNLNRLLFWICKMEGHVIISSCLLYFCVISGPIN